MAAAANNQRRDPDVIIYTIGLNNTSKRLTLNLIDRRFSTTTYGNDENKIIIKLLFTNNNTDSGPHELGISGEQEVIFQRRAADNNLGPVIYANGLYIPGSIIPFELPFESYTHPPGGERKEYSYTRPFYYIIMEYYSRETGWNGPVFVTDSQLQFDTDNNTLFYNFIRRLVINARIANILDPRLHFYYHQSHGLRMIDYGRCITSQSPEEQKKCIDDMCKLVQVRQPDIHPNSSFRRGTGRNYFTRSRNSRSKLPTRNSRSKSPTRNSRSKLPTRNSHKPANAP